MPDTTMERPGGPGALSHLRVLDLSRVLAGPWCSQNLADMGADVIKVERPGAGDDTRGWGPPWVEGAQAGTGADSTYYAAANRGKKSITMDISRPEGQEMIRKLAAVSDVVIENYKVGDLKRYGLDYAALSALNPRLVYCSITGYGQEGPSAHKPGYDFVFQAMGGLMSITGQPDGTPGEGPVKVGVALTDILTGLYASTAILAALQARHVSGQGQHIDLALLDVGVACLANQGMNYLYSGKVPGRMGNAHPNTVPYQDFPTADGYMILAIGNDGQFARFCQSAGKPEWAEDPRFKTNEARLAHRATLIPLMRQSTVMQTTRDWIAQLEQVGVPCGPINTVADVFADPQVQARGMQFEMPHPVGGDIPLVASPIRMSGTPVQYRSAPPRLGQDTAEVLAQVLGLSPAVIDDLTQQGVLG